MTTPDEDMSWFHQLLTPDEQVSLLGHPHQELPASLVERLAHQPGVTGSWWVASADPVRWMLAGGPARRLSAYRRQLDSWWDRLNDEQRDYITENCLGELGKEYAHVIQRASGTPPDQFVVCLVQDANTDYSFSLPPIIRTYVELVSH